jgi:hypothetical protein
MIHGDPGFDVFAMDISRYGDYATLAYTNAKVREAYSRRFSIRFPIELLAGRPPQIRRSMTGLGDTVCSVLITAWSNLVCPRKVEDRFSGGGRASSRWWAKRSRRCALPSA